jgi:hypothetical protein
MLNSDKRRIIEAITDTGGAKGLCEDVIENWEETNREEVEDFLDTCFVALKTSELIANA